MRARRLRRRTSRSLPYPGFPTDMQPQIMALARHRLRDQHHHGNRLFENRFKVVDELRRMGADITVDGRVAVVRGPCELTGARVEATDLRAAAALVVAGLAAEGETVIEGLQHLDRGYEISRANSRKWARGSSAGCPARYWHPKARRRMFRFLFWGVPTRRAARAIMEPIRLSKPWRKAARSWPKRFPARDTRRRWGFFSLCSPPTPSFKAPSFSCSRSTW